MLIFKAAKIEDCRELAENMRQAEIDEVMTSGAKSAYQAVKSSFDLSSFSTSLFYKDKIVLMFGVVPVNFLGSKAKVWMLTSNEIGNINVKTFLKASKYWINRLLLIYPTLYNFVDARHTKSVKWLEVCGAYIDFENPVKCNEVAFYYFELKR